VESELKSESQPGSTVGSPHLGVERSFGSGQVLHRIGLTLDMIKFAHTIFALPFALLGAVMAADRQPMGWSDPAIGWKFFWIVMACVCARSAAMSFNRLHDEPFDRLNPRTKDWALPAGLLSRKSVIGFWLVCAAGFVFSALMLNRLAFYLSPVALFILLFYSVTKRFTVGAHFFLGLALGIAPIGAWVGISGTLAFAPVLLGLAVMLWTAGFDIIYSCQDVEVDQRLGLYSLPSRWGKRRALAVSAGCHLAALLAFMLVFAVGGLGIFYLASLAICACLLAYEQSIISPTDLSRLGRAFFTLNGWISVLIFLGGTADIIFHL